MDNWDKMIEIIRTYGISAEDLLGLITDWHGTQILSDDFMDNLQDCEGYGL